MYGRFADTKVLGRITHGGIVSHDVKGQIPRPLFDILSHSYHSHRLLGAVYAMAVRDYNRLDE